MSKIGDNIKQFRNASGMTQFELGKLLGKGTSVIANWEAGTNRPDVDAIAKMLDIFGIDANAIFGWEGKATDPAQVTQQDIERIKKYHDLDNHGKDVIDTLTEKELIRINQECAAAADEQDPPESEPRYIRHYLSPAAAGYASPIEGEDYELELIGPSTPAGASFSLTVDGDSMEPYIMDRQRIYVQRDASVKDGDVGVFSISGGAVVKLYCRDPFGNIYLVSANPDRQDANVTIRHDSDATFLCQGKVLLKRKIPMP